MQVLEWTWQWIKLVVVMAAEGHRESNWVRGHQTEADWSELTD